MGFSGGKLRPYHLKPYDENISQAHADFLDWVQTTLNTLIGQKLNTTGTGIPALQNPIINPATQVSSVGSRTSRVSTVGVLKPEGGGAATHISFFYDGTNSSQPFQLFKDDGTFTTPLPGSTVVGGLANFTTYNFYPYFDELTGTVKFINNSDLSTLLKRTVTVMSGNPAIALNFSSPSNTVYDNAARQLCVAPNRVPLFTLASSVINGPATIFGPPSTQPSSANSLFLFTRAGSGY